MSIESALVAYIKADPTVYALIGERVYAMYAPERDVCPAPFMVYQRTGTEYGHTMSRTTTSPIHASFKLSGVAETYEGAIVLATAVRDWLDCFKGSMDSATVQALHVTGEQDSISMLPDLEAMQLFGRDVDIDIWYEET